MPKQSSQPHSVAILVDQGSNPFEFACACEVFGTRRREQFGFELYETQVVSAQPSILMRDGLFTLTGTADLSALETADTIVVPNRPYLDTPSHTEVLAALRRAHRRGARLVGLCTGAFTLAEAGLLHGRPAAVHWQVADQFRQLHADVDLRLNELYVDDGDILTSAGSAAALDLSLHIVRIDHGAEIANRVSRRLVFAGFREGGQQQFIDKALPESRHVPLSATLEWARQRLELTTGVTDLARHANVSPATLHRRFQDELGTTPLAWLTTERVQLALRILERTPATMDEVAHRSGLGTAANLRSLIKRHTGLSPSAYRMRFSELDPATANA
ncbi:helix-turn-helix domain-containing protein [Arthrobacter sp. NPDC080073]|uniref:GlxA family transcriptional regulator n=1 Tax=Arthrobacter sp. NPDC080073 TaxID=3155919 RepID=UPI00342AEBF8